MKITKARLKQLIREQLQKERMTENLLSSIRSYSENYCLTPEKISTNNPLGENAETYVKAPM